MRTSKKLALGAATMVALLIGLATPAAADGPFPLDTTAGTLDTELGQFDLAPDSEGLDPCVEELPEGTVALTANGTSTSGTWSVDGGYKGLFQLPGANPTTDPWYQADFSLDGSSGTYSGSSLDGTIIASVTIYEVQGPDCDKDDPQCTIVGAFGITSGTFNGTLPAANVGDDAVIDADTASGPFGPLVTLSPCNAPWSALNGTDAQLTGLTLEVQP